MKTEVDDIDLARNYWLSRDGGEVEGPFALEQLAGMWKSGLIYPTAKVCEDGTENWESITDVRRQFSGVMDASSHSVSTEPARRVVEKGLMEEARQNPIVYLALALFFGMFGIHNFWAGEVGRGLVKVFGAVMGLVAVTSGMDVGFLLLGVIAVWSLIEGIGGPVVISDQSEKETNWAAWIVFGILAVVWALIQSGVIFR